MNNVDVNDLVNGLLDQVASQAREVALLRVQLALATRPAPVEEEGEMNGSDTV